jgi:hypothetical protein
MLPTAELNAGKGTDAATDQVDEHCGRLFHDGRRDPLGFLCVQPIAGFNKYEEIPRPAGSPLGNSVACN